MSSKALSLSYTAITNPKRHRGLVLTTLAILIVFSGIYAVLVNAITGVQYKISNLNKEMVSQAAELAKNQTLLLKDVSRSSFQEEVTVQAEYASMQNISSDLSYIYADSVFADALRPHP